MPLLTYSNLQTKELQYFCKSLAKCGFYKKFGFIAKRCKAIFWKDFTVVVPHEARHNHILVLINRVLLLLEIT